MTAARPYQVEAVRAVTRVLRDRGRAQLVMACGTGKTFVGAHAARRVLGGSGLVVVACPSLALLAQTLRMWQSTVAPSHVLAVCGDETVTDSWVRATELTAPVTTDVGEIAGWVADTAAGVRLVVTTHVSSAHVGAALTTARTQADLLIIDEAHHTAGRVGKHNHLLHDNTRFPARTRLYMTATPRISAASKARRGEQDVELVSMDDEQVFGPVAYDYPLSRAIADGWLDDYRLAVIGIRTADAYAALSGLPANTAVDATAASLWQTIVQIATLKAAAEYRLRRCIVFCPRVTDARVFASTLPRLLDTLPPDQRPGGQLTARHVSGDMDIAVRERILRYLADPPGDGWTTVTNARCLGEGVDVPAVDAVVFSHPKQSTVDIVQTVGRAIRRSPSGNGVATILVPILLLDDPTNTHNTDITDVGAPGDYTVLWQVIRALRDHDDTLAAELDTQRMELSTGSSKIPSRLVLRLPDGWDNSAFAADLTVRLIRSTSSSWWEGYGAAVRFHTAHGHVDVALDGTDDDGFPLGRWLARQRNMRRKGLLAASRRRRLEALDMVWEPRKDQWQQALDAVRNYHERHGHLRVPKTHVENGIRLHTWLVQRRQAYKAGCLTTDQVSDLARLGVLHLPHDQAWDQGIHAARRFHAEHGHLTVPALYLDESGFPLGRWLTRRRKDYQTGTMPPERIAELTTLGMQWLRRTDQRWQRGIEAARHFYAEHGHLRVPAPYVTTDGFRLGAWISARRTDYRLNRLTSQRITELENLGMTWRIHGTDNNS